MSRPVAVLALCLAALPVSAQDAVRRVVVAEIEREAIHPILTPAEVLGLVQPEFDAAERREQRRPRFEQSSIRRGLSASEFRLEVDAQFEDGNDFLLSLDLETVEYRGRRLLVLTRTPI